MMHGKFDNMEVHVVPKNIDYNYTIIFRMCEY